MKPKFSLAAIVAGSMAFLPCLTIASGLASDNAADPAYNAGWTNGSNGGFGWGSAWVMAPTGTGATFTGNSASNGDGDTSPPIGDINSPQTASGRAWGFSAADVGGDSARATRAFNGALSVGQTFHFNLDTGFFSSTSGLIDILLLNAVGDEVWAFSLEGGVANYEIFASGGFSNSGIPASDEGIDVAFTLTSATAWSAAIGVLGTVPTVFTGSLFPEATGTDVSSVQVFNTRAGAAPSQFAYFNNISIVPEPSTLALLGLGGLIVVAKLRRRL